MPPRIEGMELLHELWCEEETERDKARLQRIRMVCVHFPSETIEIVAAYDEIVCEDCVGLTHILTKGEV
jgi:hypothetical protein